MKTDRTIGTRGVARNPTGTLPLALTVLASPLAGMMVATLYLAIRLHQSSCYPWNYLLWQHLWRAHYPNIFRVADSLMLVVVSLVLFVCFLAKASRQRLHANENLHGSARWGSEADLKKAGLLGNQEGVYVGAWEDRRGQLHYLRHNGPEHILTYAPTRSGKGVGLVIPTLLSWRHSAVITDLKGELWALTAGWRRQHAHNQVIRFEPASLTGAAWNPLDEIRAGTENEVGDVQNLATLIIDPDGKGLETHWQKTSQALLVGFILHGIYKLRHEGREATLPGIDSMLVDADTNIANLLIEMMQYPHCNGTPHPVIAASSRDMTDRPPEEAGSVLSTLKSYLALYRDPVVAKNVSRSDFRIKDLMNHRHPVSLYIVTQPNDKARLQPLVRILLNMVVRLLADKMEFEQTAEGVRTKKTYRHRLLCMIDEFPSLGRLDILQESLAFVAGYGLKFYLICQDINQLKSRERGYGPDETITSNCHIQNAYPPNRVETAEHLSKLTGLTTIVKKQLTLSGRRFGGLEQRSETLQEVQRPLLTVDECLRMPGPEKNAAGDITKAGDMVIYVAGFPAIYGKQPLYFKDPVFAARAAIAAPAVSDVLHPRLSPEEEIRL
ncbi:conjugal transfer coupling protein TraG [Legionella geestiana]|uniref:Conjugal transfer coupling protein TraG n=1 Tax=Legionella geestiana TaxID=45065 RepID=A0A0W0U7Q7_9GAMM|nr:type IV secretory system conjugative DNA transfer family protein [Legionella geestiana]KTD03692.1 conjugal transfer coupling protein TraG [Legionella geestiana]QBS11536.1 conjugal transfer protein TraG [Legionella geestiana]STX53794.1 Conjugal transfer protein traG [Legionella geestiana]